MNNLNDLVIDLPNLKSISLGPGALEGKDDSSTSLIIKSNIDMNELIFRSS